MEIKIEEHPGKNKYKAGTKVGKAVGHEGNRKKVCGPCGRKILGKDKRILNNNNVQINSIKENIDADFDILNSAYPVQLEFVKDVEHSLLRFPKIQPRNLFFQS